MKILFYLGHPAHFHLFKNVIKPLSDEGHKISVLIKKKDILEDLLLRSDIPYLNLLPEGRKDHKLGIAVGVIKRDWRLLWFCLRNRPDLMIGTSVEIGHVGTILKITSLNVNEDDADVVPFYSRFSYPWSTIIISPVVCNNGKWEKKSVKYNGYHELAYLHPDHFVPSFEIVKKYIRSERPYFLIRFAKLKAHHDSGIRGITDSLAMKIIEVLKSHGNVYITSERELGPQFEPFRLQIDPLDIHHVMSFATFFIGDSQTMAAESGVLGTPFIRINDFVGKIGYLNELEERFGLGFGIKPDNEGKLFETIEYLLSEPDLRSIWHKKMQRMLSEKINLAEFLISLIKSKIEA